MTSRFSKARTGMARAAALAIVVALWVRPRVAAAGGEGEGEVDALSDVGSDVVVPASRAALIEARAALGANPPNREAARAALERAIASNDDAVAVAEAYFRRGVLEEENGAFARAVADQRACMAKGPISNFARSARLRIGWIDARSEGSFVPLARLQRVRRDPALLNDPTAMQSLAIDAEAFPPGRVRAEARMFVAGAWMNRMNRREDAIAELHKVASDPSSDSMDATLAHRRLADAFLADGRLDEAESELRGRPVDSDAGVQLRRLLRRRTLRRLARVEFAAFFGLAFIGVAAARSRRARGFWQSTKIRLRGPTRVALAAAVTLLCCVSLCAAVFAILDATNAKALGIVGL